jgi:hypothetical protein
LRGTATGQSRDDLKSALASLEAGRDAVKSFKG